MLGNIFVIQVMNFIGVFLKTSLKFISVEVILVGGAVSIAGSRFNMLITWLNLEGSTRQVDTPWILTVLHS